MFTQYLSIAAAGMLVSSVALAQASAPSSGDTAKPATNSEAPAPGKNESVRQEMTSTLQSAGFSNVRVMPDSFLVQAKDKSGHPVAMIINPNSMTEIVDEGAVGGSSAAQANAGGQDVASADSTKSDATFTEVPAQERLSSAMVGSTVYNGQNQDVGTIKDIAYGQGRVKAYIVGVGGFLGMGDHYVAVQPSAMKFSYDSANKQWHAEINATADQLKQAPAYTFPNQG